jgi:hypothetical protein
MSLNQKVCKRGQEDFLISFDLRKLGNELSCIGLDFENHRLRMAASYSNVLSSGGEALEHDNAANVIEK